MDPYQNIDDLDGLSEEFKEKINKGYIWKNIVFARAETYVNNVYQPISSSGLGGIFSNNTTNEDIKEIIEDQIDELKDILKELGFDITDIDKKIELVQGE